MTVIRELIFEIVSITLGVILLNFQSENFFHFGDRLEIEVSAVSVESHYRKVGIVLLLQSIEESIITFNISNEFMKLLKILATCDAYSDIFDWNLKS